MNAEQFLKIVNQGDNLNREQVNQLFKLHENFPYFQIPNVLLAKYENKKNKDAGSEFLAWSAINSPNRSWLKRLIEDPNSISELFQENQSLRIDQTTEQSPDIEEEDTESELIPKPIPEQNPTQRAGLLKKLGENLTTNSNSGEKESQEKKKEVKKPRKKRPGSDDLIETIKKKEKKEIVDEKKKEQIDIIKSFSKKEIKLATIKEIENFQKQSDLSENSTQLNPNLLSESYAKLLSKQGKNKKAKEIYQKLMVKFPNKSTYFADLIKELEEKS
ncbi:hypothetical protein Belba_3427 [Belliella baltica DSM 15883]|uniref:Tetratricopeptide repeat protein n=1 Tax=Belliella baltica (strain DSM 15883 / CIP 108006 / LMG 21964 / BA134) TaxID=866536 RepID=I3Z9L1_BELBD|nr:hypothetical protein [Belliella baltica]AFL85929.1 hypothetical protein Belba_3427 [Belliella baltica DSM 15883]